MAKQINSTPSHPVKPRPKRIGDIQGDQTTQTQPSLPTGDAGMAMHNFFSD